MDLCPETNTSPLPEDLPYAYWLELMLDFWQKGGHVARHNQNKITAALKADNTLVTEVDLAISAHAQSIFAPLKDQGHLILDEETAAQTGSPTKELFAKHDFIWAIDPIDGTSSYAARLPSYAISVGLLYKGRPVMGGVYMPATDDLFVNDGQQALLMQHPFSTKVHTEPLQVMAAGKSHGFFDIVSQRFLRQYQFTLPIKKITASNAMCVGMANVAAGRVQGAYFQANLWDLAGPWALLQGAGATVCHMDTGKPLQQITPNMMTSSWCIKNDFICCNPRFFNDLRKHFEAYSSTKEHG